MGYRGTWNSTDQIPTRAVADGRIGRFGLVDSTDGGRVVALQRLARVAAQQRERQHHAQRLRPRLRPQPVLELHLLPRRPGERRSVPAGRSPLRERRASHAPPARPVGRPAGAEHGRRAGPERRHQRRRPLSHARAASGSRRSARTRCSRPAPARSRRTRPSGRRGCGRSPACASTAIASTSTPASPRTAATDDAGLVSPKGGAVFGPFAKTELYVNAGLGFHSNDARGATITVDPATGEPASA